MKAYCAVFLVPIAIVGCASAPNAPTPRNDQSGGIGVVVKLTLLGFTTFRADVVYFVKRCPAGSPCDERLLASNYVKGGRAYLLNTEPGDYVVVAAATDNGLFGQRYLNFAYFSQALIDRSAITVNGPGLVFGGRYDVTASLGLCPENADAIQLKHAEMIEPGTPKCGFWETYFFRLSKANLGAVAGKMVAAGDTPPSHYREIGYLLSQDDRDAAEFVIQAREDLAAAGWKIGK